MRRELRDRFQIRRSRTLAWTAGQSRQPDHQSNDGLFSHVSSHRETSQLTGDAGQRNNWQIGALEGIAAVDLPLAKTYRAELAGKQHPQTAETLRWVEQIIQRYEAAAAAKSAATSGN